MIEGVIERSAGINIVWPLACVVIFFWILSKLAVQFTFNAL